MTELLAKQLVQKQGCPYLWNTPFRKPQVTQITDHLSDTSPSFLFLCFEFTSEEWTRETLGPHPLR